jgi:hypothetical protein
MGLKLLYITGRPIAVWKKYTYWSIGQRIIPCELFRISLISLTAWVAGFNTEPNVIQTDTCRIDTMDYTERSH